MGGDLKIGNLVSKYYFDKIYDKYTKYPNGWKLRTDLEKEELFDNYKIVKSGSEYMGGFSIKDYMEGYLLESFFTEVQGQGFGSIVMDVIKFNTDKNIYAFSKNETFYGFKKLDEVSETGASLFVYESKKYPLQISK